MKFAAIGVISVPQKPASMPIAATTAGSPPYCLMSKGMPTAASITGKAAKALPITIVNSAMPSPKASTAPNRLPCGMALFTMVMGNAFAAFPVMLAAVGMPLLIKQHGGDPAVVAAIGMLAGFCGTLMTPMAANFNLVPAALLELKNPYGVIRAQIGTALPLLAVNILFIYLFAF